MSMSELANACTVPSQPIISNLQPMPEGRKMASQLSPTVSCLECQRRKQKCNRQFPCNHCLRRGVAHLCRFMTKPTASKANKSNPSVDDGPSRKRNLDAIEDASPLEGSDHLDGENPSFNASSALSALGYMPHTHHAVLGRGSGPMVGNDFADQDEEKEPSEELKTAIKMVHPKPYTDCLVDNWLGGANYHYCALYPPEFRTQYDGWWTVRTDNPSPELTSLILRVCACSLLFIIDGSVKERLESELRADSSTLATRLHEAAEALGASIPHGKGGLIHVQQLFLTAFWYKSAEKWTEAWHALSTAIGAAYEIGLHQDSSSEGMSEFDREMRRRLWCVLYLWDFALSSMLSRPMLINRADCTFEMPTLALEVNPGQPYQPSPFRHMKLHCQMCIDMAEGMASIPSDKAATDLAPRLRAVVDRWFANLPAEYAVKNPDTRWDDEHDWVVFQRRYLHLVGYMFLFSPLKPYVTRSSAKPMTEQETELRAAGVQAALALMDVSWSFFENLASFGAKFHYAVFCIFDTTTVLCSAFVHDEGRTLPQRETALGAIKRGLKMLEELRSVSKTTSDLCRILKSLLSNLPLNPKEKALIGIAKRAKGRQKPSPASDAAGASSVAAAALGSPPATEAEQTISLASPGSETDISAVVGPDEVEEEDAGPDHSSSSSGQSGIGPSSPFAAATSSSASSYRIENPPHTMASPEDGHVQEAGAPDAHLHPPGLLPPGSMAQLHEPLYGNFQPPPGFEMPAMNHGEWHSSTDVVGDMQAFQGDHIGYDPNMPTVLEYWDWQGLDLGHPGFWGNPHPPPPSM